MLYVCVFVCAVLHIAFGLDLYPFGKVGDLLVVPLPGEGRVLVHLAGLESQNNVA